MNSSQPLQALLQAEMCRVVGQEHIEMVSAGSSDGFLNAYFVLYDKACLALALYLHLNEGFVNIYSVNE